MAIKPFITAGVALTSAALIVAGTPALLSPTDAKTVAASTPTPTKLSQAKYNLTTLENVLGLTPADYQSAYFDGWGPFVTSADSYGFGSGSAPTGVGGVLYLVADNLVWDGVTADPAPNVVNYYFELGAGPAFYIAAQKLGPPVSTVVDLVNEIYVAPTLITEAVLGAATPIPLVGAAANAYLNGFNGGNTGAPGVIAYAVNNVIGRLPALDPANIVGFFVGDGANADAATCGDNCNGGNAGILWGNGGDGANGGSGGNAGFFIGNGGNGADGADATYDAATDEYTANTAGGNGGWGGFLVGNGGNGGKGGSDTTALAGDGVGADGGTGGTAGILSGNGGTGGDGGDATTIDGSAYGGYGGAGGQSGFAGNGADGGAGGSAVAVSLDPAATDVVAVGGDGGAGGASFAGTAGTGGAGGDADYTGAPAGDAAGGAGGAGGASTPLGTAGAAGADGGVTPAPAAALKKVAAKVSGALSSAAPGSTASKVAKSLKSKPAKSTKGEKAGAASGSDSE